MTHRGMHLKSKEVEHMVYKYTYMKTPHHPTPHIPCTATTATDGRTDKYKCVCISGAQLIECKIGLTIYSQSYGKMHID